MGKLEVINNKNIGIPSVGMNTIYGTVVRTDPCGEYLSGQHVCRYRRNQPKSETVDICRGLCLTIKSPSGQIMTNYCGFIIDYDKKP